MKMVNFGLTIFVGCYIFVTSLNYSAERQVRLPNRENTKKYKIKSYLKIQVHRVRILYLRSVLGQDMTWFDTQTTNNFASKMTELELTST